MTRRLHDWVILCNRGVCVFCVRWRKQWCYCATQPGFLTEIIKIQNRNHYAQWKYFHINMLVCFWKPFSVRMFEARRIWRENEWERNVTNPKCLQSVSRVNNCYSGKFWVHFMISQFPHWGIGEFYMLCVWYSFLNVWFLSSPWMWADLCSRSWECVCMCKMLRYDIFRMCLYITGSCSNSCLRVQGKTLTYAFFWVLNHNDGN